MRPETESLEALGRQSRKGHAVYAGVAVCLLLSDLKSRDPRVNGRFWRKVFIRKQHPVTDKDSLSLWNQVRGGGA
jgi:hypothetical protein